jgi:hypothetical protein
MQQEDMAEATLLVEMVHRALDGHLEVMEWVVVQIKQQLVQQLHKE